ncbi:NUDIX domain-containing protein [Gordonia sp. PP30]|uniref:NUDIX domain-containing protein n=1 Tax=unclassified Gordonia (in: high G+C Gram-positive bacteria) TaxID=2657482 RepID=UPI002000429E|nr:MULTISPECIES: NUDIX domain-containing protein [unclassified Gordonia (in: high G+C Gram-positive bacteria)]UQE74332.1 NUDIX domain-containing protein [Gordonia sp. PP30]
MAEHSAGILLYRGRGDDLRVLLVHPGGPFFAKKDDGAWSIPKGLVEEGEDLLAAARREFAEETGHAVPDGIATDLGQVRLRGGKYVTAFALEGDFDPDTLRSNTFELAWPPRSGRTQVFPEVDRAGWFGVDEAAVKLNPAQVPLIERLREALGAG